MAKGFKINAILVCDEIRREENGKFIFLGVYSDAVIVKSFPARLQSFTVYISGHVDNKDIKKVSFCIEGPKKIKMIEGIHDFKINKVDEQVVFIFALQAPVFYVEGEYIIKLGLDSSPRKVSTFVVREPSNKDERRRVGLN